MKRGCQSLVSCSCNNRLLRKTQIESCNIHKHSITEGISLKLYIMNKSYYQNISGYLVLQYSGI